MSFKEFVAEMDCCMGGRVAEELSMPPSYIIYILINAASLVYGPENVTSGCISDLAHATDVATRMVQVYIAYPTYCGGISQAVFSELWIFPEDWASVL